MIGIQFSIWFVLFVHVGLLSQTHLLLDQNVNMFVDTWNTVLIL